MTDEVKKERPLKNAADLPLYPKWVDGPQKDANGNSIRVIVNSPDEEDEVEAKVKGGGKPPVDGFK